MGFIYWIASYPKSGNTWARAFLTSLIADGARDESGRLPQIMPDENSGQFYQPFLQKPVDAASNAELAQVRPRVHRMLAEKTQNFLLLKTHSRLGMHNGTPTVSFDVSAGAIYLLRNPLDVAVTYSEGRARGLDGTIKAMNQRDREAPRIANRSYEILGSWSEHVTSWTQPHDRILVVRQEDMLANPPTEFRRMLQFLRMEAGEDQLARALAESQPMSDRSGLWREALTREQVASVVSRHKSVMQRFGYWLEEFDELVPARAAIPT